MPQVKVKSLKSSEKLITDAQGFIDAWKNFQKKPSTEPTSNTEISSEDPPGLSFRTKDWPVKETPRFDIAQGTSFRKEFITFVEVHFFTTKRLPTKTEVSRRLGKITDEDWEALIVSTQDSLTNRGIRPYDTPVGYLEPNFVLAVNLLCSVHDRRSVEAKLKEAGLTTKQWHSFLRTESYMEYWRARLDEIYTEDVREDTRLALAELVAARDLQAIKYVNELDNVYRPASSNDLVMKMLQIIIDIVAIHVDPATLGKIANDIQSSEIINVTERPPNAISSKK